MKNKMYLELFRNINNNTVIFFHFPYFSKNKKIERPYQDLNPGCKKKR